MIYGKNLIKVILIFVFSGFAAVYAEEQVDKFKDINIESIQVRDGIYMLTGQGGNIGVFAGEDGVFMIDDQFAPLTDKIKKAIANISTKPIRFLINTHWHFDHTGGNENLGKEDVVIVAHNNVRQRMSKDNFIKAFNKMVPAAPEVALPVITFNDTVSFHLNKQEIEVVHQANAHTDGDSVVYFKSANVIHAGDVFFNGLYPFIDSQANGSVNGVIRAVDKILAAADDKTQIIPGHGPLGDKKSLKQYRHMLVTARDRLQKHMEKGKNLEQIIDLKPLADFDKNWGNGFLSPDVFLKILYAAMPGK